MKRFNLLFSYLLSFSMILILFGCADKSTNPNNTDFSNFKNFSFRFENLHVIYHTTDFSQWNPMNIYKSDTTYEVFNFTSNYANTYYCSDTILSVDMYQLTEGPLFSNILTFQIDKKNNEIHYCNIVLQVGSVYHTTRSYHDWMIELKNLPCDTLTNNLISINIKGQNISDNISKMTDINSGNDNEGPKAFSFLNEIITLLPCTDSTKLTITISK